MSETKRLIGITGAAGAGKDTVKTLLKETMYLELSTYSFASPIYDTVMNLFGWTIVQLQDREFKETIDPKWGFSPRRAMQLLGTEFGRELREDIWIHFARVLLDSPFNSGLIVSDVRFENEAAFIRENGGTLLHIVRPYNPNAIAATHASEGGVQFVEGTDHLIINDGTLEDLLHKLETTLKYKEF